MSASLAQLGVAVVSGAASRAGIGYAVCRRLAAAGHAIAVCDRDGEGAAAAARALGEEFGVPVLGAFADVGDEESVQRFRDVVERELGPARVLVNNAGVNRSAPLADISREDWDEVLRVNTTGGFLMTQAFAPAMQQLDWGRIVFVSSLAALRGGGFFLGSAHYAASKAAVLGLMRALARELGPDGITVNAIAPGYVESEMTSGAGAAEREKAMIARTPVRSIGSPDEVAAAIAFLASEDARYITGATVDVNGGSHIR